MVDLFDYARERVVLFDGGMGTQIQAAGLSLDDFWGLENCSEVLNLSRPDLIRDIHRRYLLAGADALETNSFGGRRLPSASSDLPIARARSIGGLPSLPSKRSRICPKMVALVSSSVLLAPERVCRLWDISTTARSRPPSVSRQQGFSRVVCMRC